jgi:hypothetical protein
MAASLPEGRDDPKAQRRRTYDAARALVLHEVEPTNPLARRFADDVAGAFNRREVAERHYRDVLAACDELSESIRGRIGRRVSGLPETCDG